jgi:hypothetical protein
MGNASHLAALMLLFGAATADAQVTPPATTTGVYQQLSAGNQKIARALFEAQVQPTIATTTPGARTPAVGAGDSHGGRTTVVPPMRRGDPFCGRANRAALPLLRHDGGEAGGSAPGDSADLV